MILLRPQLVRLSDPVMALLSVEDATSRILKDVARLNAEDIVIAQAQGRVLARPISARHTQPPFDSSAMDGYAVRGEDVSDLPARLRVIGESAAGRGFVGTVQSGKAVRIFTGAPVPTGADAVVIQENVTRDGDQVVVTEGQPDPAHIRKKGFDFGQGDTLISEGTKMAPRLLTLAAAAGHGKLSVVRQPKVAILATGSELVEPGEALGPDQIVSSNPIGVAGIVENAGAHAMVLGIAKDSQADLEAKLKGAQGADILVTIGGVSVGEHDLVGPVLKKMGMVPDFWKIAMRPGKPLLFGRLGETRVIGVPGNPVSSLICTRVFVVPLIRKLLGLPGDDMGARPGVVQHDMDANGPRAHYMRAVFAETSTGALHVSAVPSQDSSLLMPLSQANGFIVRPPNAPKAAKGENVTVLPLDF